MKIYQAFIIDILPVRVKHLHRGLDYRHHVSKIYISFSRKPHYFGYRVGDKQIA